MPTPIWRAFAMLLLLLPGQSLAQDTSQPVWTRYTDPDFRFSVDLPLGLFEPLPPDAAPGMALVEGSGSGQLNIYGGAARGLTLDQFEQRLSAGDQVLTITYRAGGRSWFVLSGDYAPDSTEEPLIFYTKVLLSRDGDSFSAFEISYPRDQKARFDPIVERIEDSMTRPGAAG